MRRRIRFPVGNKSAESTRYCSLLDRALRGTVTGWYSTGAGIRLLAVRQLEILYSREVRNCRGEYAKKVCAFCMWACVGTGVVLSAVFLIFMDQILALVGASADTWEPARTYLVTVAFGGPFVLISNCYSNVIRAEGQSGNSILSIHIQDFSVKDKISGKVLSIGIPASLGFLLMSISQIIVNARMAGYGDMALAGIGVAMKVTMITGMVCIGQGQGVQPLLGYCVGAGAWERLKKIMKFSLIFALGLSVGMTGLCYLFSGRIVGVFLTEGDAFDYAVSFTNILLTTSVLFGIFYVLANALQAMGAAREALVINLSRQGLIYIPAVFLLQALFGVFGLAWAQPVADLISTLFVAVLYFKTEYRLEKQKQEG